jgi:hypothetical protein
MKSYFLGLLCVAVLAPQLLFAAPVSAQYYSLFQQLISLFELRISQLEQLASAQSGTLLLANEDSFPVTALATTTTLGRKINSASGGGSPVRPGAEATSTDPIATSTDPGDGPTATSTDPGDDLVRGVIGTSNSLRVTGDSALMPEAVYLSGFSVDDSSVLPVSLSLYAYLTSGDYLDIPLYLVPETDSYEGFLVGVLGDGEAWSGVFTVVFPEDVRDAVFTYTATYEEDGELYPVTLENMGQPQLALQAAPEPVTTGYFASGVFSTGVPVWNFLLVNDGLVDGLLRSVAIAVDISSGVPTADFFTSVDLVVSGAGTFPGTVTEGMITFALPDGVTIPAESSTEIVVEATITPQTEAVELQFDLHETDVAAVSVDMIAVPVSGSLIDGPAFEFIPQVLVFNETSFFAEAVYDNPPQETSAAFRFSFTLEAQGGDYYIWSDSFLVEDFEASGIGYEVNGDYGGGELSSTVTINLPEIDSGLYMIPAGESAEVEVMVYLTSSQDGYFSVGLRELWYTTNPDGVSEIVRYTFTPEDSYDSPTILVLGS